LLGGSIPLTEKGKKRAPRNRTITLTKLEQQFYRSRFIQLSEPATLPEIIDRTICQDIFELVDWLPDCSIDLLFADPPYNLSKSFNNHSFTQMSLPEYEQWLESWLGKLVRILKPTASIYICGDWRSSTAIHRVVDKLFIVRNRITWEREKGRGAKTNWKNCSEDIWFCTVSNDYTFNVEAVKLKRRVMAPYTDRKGCYGPLHRSQGETKRLE
jgi:site-specific DNA-methyltransferase (adenine-specific)